jgi:hypothetical protein
MSNTSPYELAGAMLHRDRFLILIPLVLLAATELAVLLFPFPNTALLFTVVVARRSIELLGLAVIFQRWLSAISGTPALANRSNVVRLLWVGFGVWFLALLPRLLLAPGAPIGIAAAVALLWLGGAVFLYLHFLYGPVILGGAASPGTILAESRAFTRGDRYLPLKILAPGFAVSTGLSALIMMPAPDHSILALTVVAALVAPLFWVLQSYLAVAWYFTALSDPAALRLNLHQYRESKLTTIALNGHPWIAALLRPDRAGWGVFVAVVIWAGNLVATQSMGPHATITEIAGVRTTDSLTVQFLAQDKSRSLRGFSPTSFNVREREGTLLPSALVSCSFQYRETQDSDEKPCGLLESTDSPVQFKLKFALSAPKDGATVEPTLQPAPLDLWYRAVKISKIPSSAPLP